jgi:DNA-binding NtrC family response regulator
MQKHTALVVEDEWLLLDIVEAELSEAGFQVVTATSGSEAMLKLEHAAGDLTCLLTDIRLGQGTDGWQVAQRARGLNPKLPVLHMTGDSQVHRVANAVPGSMLLSKPFALAQLTDAVTQLVKC